MKSLEELKADYAEKEKKLKEEKEKLFKQAKARQAKSEALERVRLRKADAHIKIVIGGFYLAIIKANKDVGQIDDIIKTVKTKKTRELLIALKKSFSE